MTRPNDKRVSSPCRDPIAALDGGRSLDAPSAAFRGVGTRQYLAAQSSSEVGRASSSTDARMAMEAPTRRTLLTRIS